MIPCKQMSGATSGTVTVVDSQDDVHLILTGGLAIALTIAFPANPLDGQRVTITSDSGVTALTMTTPVGSIVNALTTLSLGSNTFIFDAAGNKWHR